MLGAGLAGSAQAAEILVTTDISVSTTWTADNTYNLQDQIYVLPGATLTIEAGTIVASTTNLGGSLAVCKGAQIFVQGTACDPVIITSKADVATWTNGDPKTGVWRESANEHGNLTVMGAGYISENATAGNVPTPDANNVAAMEGLVEDFPGDTKILYGGGNDDDDSGSISYLSLRYGGKVINLNNELNGISLGGLGRGTDVHHVDVMNNVDDGAEVWGGTVNLKYFNIWNIGDDSFDNDQGWRGKAQFVSIVQGYSLDAAQGSGVGDNCFEIDGAEDSDWQPVSTACVYNATVIGQPVAGDHGTAWRDNARYQFRNCVFMDLGEQLVKLDNVDGDGANGYGFNGTLSWADTWTTDWNMVPAHANDPANPADFYKSQVDGKLAEIKDSVFFSNLHASAYTEATARGVFDVANNNVLIPGDSTNNPGDAPIVKVTRGPEVIKGGLLKLYPVIGLDPRPANEALVSVGTAPNDGFYTQAQYRGAFAPNATPWIVGWTACDAFGFLDIDLGTVYCDEAQNPNNAADISIDTTDSSACSINVTLSNGPPNQFVYLLVGNGMNVVNNPPGTKGSLCIVGGNCLGRYDKDVAQIDAAGTYNVDLENVLSNPCQGNVNIVPGATWNFQFWHRQPMGTPSTFSSALSVTFN